MNPTLSQLNKYKAIADEAAHKIRIMWQAPDHSTQEDMISEIVFSAISVCLKIKP